MLALLADEALVAELELAEAAAEAVLKSCVGSADEPCKVNYIF